ncbi:transcription antitermination protein NusB [Bacteroidaceae bacterium]|nr:transcription antitermination protein NusB [Bacteroidaceae bacterium]
MVQLTYAYYQNEGKTIEVAEKELMFSMGKAYDLYKYLLSVLVRMKTLAEQKDAAFRARNKRLQTHTDDVTPDGRFAANLFLAQLAENKELGEYIEKQKQDWIEEDAFLKKTYTKFMENDVFRFYLDKEDYTYEADREVVRKLYKTCICNNEDFDSLLEDHSLYWNDDKDIIDSFVLKTIKRFNEASTPEQPLLPEFASDEDREFAVKLFRTTLERGMEMRQLIKDNCKNWEFNRLAYMDVIIMQIALTEIFSIPNIPLNVTFNEYLDIAKIYSTPRSASYINGLLDSIVKKAKSENKLLK